MHLSHGTCRHDGHPEVVWRRGIGFGVQQRAVTLKTLALLLDGDQLNVSVDEYHEHYGQPKTYRRGHLSHHHEKPAVTGDADHRLFWPTEFRRQCRWNAKPH